MKKTLIYSLLVLFLFNSSGYYFLFELNKYLARKEMQSILQCHPLHMAVIRVNDARNDPAYQRIDRTEFRYKGALYDIVREFRSGPKTVFICIHDDKESRLFDGMKKMGLVKQYLALWDQVTLIFLSAPADEMAPVFAGNLVFPHTDISLQSSMLPTWSPPPERL